MNRNRRNITALALTLLLTAPVAMAAPGKEKGRAGKADQKKERLTTLERDEFRRGDRDLRNRRHRGLDRNGDGFVTREEWRGNDRSFRVHDRNGDGILSGDELRAGRGRQK